MKKIKLILVSLFLVSSLLGQASSKRLTRDYVLGEFLKAEVKKEHRHNYYLNRYHRYHKHDGDHHHDHYRQHDHHDHKGSCSWLEDIYYLTFNLDGKIYETVYDPVDEEEFELGWEPGYPVLAKVSRNGHKLYVVRTNGTEIDPYILH